MPAVIEQSAGGPTVRLNGDVAIGAARELKGALIEALAFCRELKIDLTGVTALDMTTLQLLWAAQDAAAKAGIRVILTGPVPEGVEQAMGLASMERFAVDAK